MIFIEEGETEHTTGQNLSPTRVTRGQETDPLTLQGTENPSSASEKRQI